MSSTIKLKLKPKHEDTLIARMIDTFRQIIYHMTEVIPCYSKMKPWEEKEYRGVHENNLAKLEDMKQTLLANKDAFKPMLAEYGLTVDKFLSGCLNQAAHQTEAISALSGEVFRAWSRDWAKSYVFYGSLINSIHWDTFQKKMNRLLGKDWGFERALTDHIDVDINKSIEFLPIS